MIRQAISQQIWELKYRDGQETELEYYNRVAEGLFGNLTEEETKKYANVLGHDVDVKAETADKLRKHLCSLAGRGMYTVGTDRKNQTLSNCFVLPFKKDSMSAIMDTAKESAMTMKAGGGVGYSISILRPSSVIISTSKTTSSGAVSFLKILDATCSTIKAGNSRRGAQMVAMGIWHPDIKQFITAKRKGDLKNFNMSVFVSDEFMKTKDENGDFDLVFPDVSFEKYDEEWDGNIKLWKQKGYPIIVHETVKARDLWDLIMESNYKFAEPGVLFEDTINDRNTLWYSEYIQTTNPCGEQPLYWYGSCNLAPINLSNMVDNPFSEKAVFNWVRYIETIQLTTVMLDRMLDISYYPLPEQAEEVRKKRLIGLGFTGLGDMLSKLRIPYSSDRAVKMAETVTRALSEYSYLTSAWLAKEFGKFPDYDERILESYNVQLLPPSIQEIIKKHGLRNSRLTSIAPVGTISIVMNNTSSGIEPNFALEYTRKIKADDGSDFFETVETDAWNLYKNSEYYDGTVPDFFETAQDLKPLDHIRIQAAVQKWICTAVSKTTNCPIDISFEDFKEIYDFAYNNGLKGCTTYRPNDIIGSVLEVKKEEKNTKKDKAKEQKEFFDVWKKQESGLVQYDNVSLPSEYPMKGYKIKSEGKKWYVHVAFKDKQCTNPFAIFVSTNNRETEVNTYNALDKLNTLAYNSGISKNVVEDNNQKSASQTNVIKVCRAIGMLLRHNVPIIQIIKTLDNVDVPVSSFIFRMKKFLMMFIEEVESNGSKCPECGAAIEFRDGCQSCSECFWSKCA